MSPSLDRLQFDILSAAFSLMCGLCRQLGRLEALQLADAVPFDLADLLCCLWLDSFRSSTSTTLPFRLFADRLLQPEMYSNLSTLWKRL